MINDYYPSKYGPYPKVDLISNFLQVTTTSFVKWLPVKLPVFYIINFSQLPQATEYWSCQFKHTDLENDWQIKHSLKIKHPEQFILLLSREMSSKIVINSYCFHMYDFELFFFVSIKFS